MNPNQSQNSLPRAKHHANYNMEAGEAMDDDVREYLTRIAEEDDSHTISEGNEDQDIRFNPNKNDKEIDRVSKTNQLR